jgi:4-hydroxy-4-methyl-2-oxoglutarate aldolase
MNSNESRIAHLDAATISDALDRLGICGQCQGISPQSSSKSVAGRAFTLRYGPASSPAGTVGDYIDDVPPGAIVVLDNGGREDATVWGDILTEVAHRNGIAATLIHGICRDIALARQLEYPIFSRGHWMRTGKDRVQVEEMAIAVNVGNARIAQDDLLKGDSDGLVVIPKAHEEQVITLAEKIAAAEESIRAAVRSGQRLDEARRQSGYHSLQTRDR